MFGEGWRDEWLRRIEGTEPWLLRWLEEQVDGPYWRHGSCGRDTTRIVCPTMLVAGWADGYRTSRSVTSRRSRCPKRLVIGPWSHMSTQTSLPGPHIDLVPELIRWFGRWLRDDDERHRRRAADRACSRDARHGLPPISQRCAESGAPRQTWPPTGSAERTLSPAGHGSDDIAVRGDIGRTAWISCAARLPWGQPADQRPDDAFSLVYEWEPLAAELDVMGIHVSG